MYIDAHRGVRSPATIPEVGIVYNAPTPRNAARDTHFSRAHDIALFLHAAISYCTTLLNSITLVRFACVLYFFLVIFGVAHNCLCLMGVCFLSPSPLLLRLISAVQDVCRAAQVRCVLRCGHLGAFSMPLVLRSRVFW